MRPQHGMEGVRWAERVAQQGGQVGADVATGAVADASDVLQAEACAEDWVAGDEAMKTCT